MCYLTEKTPAVSSFALRLILAGGGVYDNLDYSFAFGHEDGQNRQEGDICARGLYSDAELTRVQRRYRRSDSPRRIISPYSDIYQRLQTTNPPDRPGNKKPGSGQNC